jgi:peptide/nickel transport system substrate-binding protein
MSAGMAKSKIMGTILLALAAAGLSASETRAQERPVLRIGVQQLTTTGKLEAVGEYSNVALRGFYSFFEPLIDYDRQDAKVPVKPGLALSWARLDERTVELKLRQGVKFHNGDEMTSEDVAFSFGEERMFGKGTPGATGETKEPPAAAVQSIRSLWPALDKAEAVDRYTVRFVNKTPDPTMEGRLSRIGSEIISKRAFMEAPTWNAWARKPVGTGPYKVVEFSQDNILVLDAHDDYWGGKPPVRQIRWQVAPEVASRVSGLLSGQFDFITDVPPDQIRMIAGSGKFEVVGGPVNNHRLLNFDKNHPVLKDVRIRRAMTHAIDRQLLADTLFDGRVVVPNGLQWPFYGDFYVADWKTPAYDPALARRLIAEAGYKGEPIAYRALAYNYYTNQVPVSQAVVEMWRTVGLNVVIESKENWSQVLEKSPGRGMRDWSNSAPYNDPVSSMVSQHCPRGQQQQIGEWANEEFNKLCVVLETSGDAKERQAAFGRMLSIIEVEDPGYVLLHQTTLLYGKRKDIRWAFSPLQSMDFRTGNLAFVP